ncbi:MAG TPA: hypothetical protein ENI23_10915 [bacterium]|nr:hypothetical protein [bacterium]
MTHGEKWEQGDKFVNEKGIEKMHGDGEGNWVHFSNLPLLSIGQMIEFLDENKELTTEYIAKSGLLTPSNIDSFKKISWKPNTELCDSLWEAVKEVLEK